MLQRVAAGGNIAAQSQTELLDIYVPM